jgi:uncharacterized membrane protein YesL
VQLGVGLHAGTAILQLYGEIALAPLVRRLNRIRGLVAIGSMPADVIDELARVESDFEIFKIQHFNAYKKFVKANFGFAAILVILLIVLAYMANSEIPLELTFGMVALSVLPAPITLAVLWIDASGSARQIRVRAERLERRAIEAAGPSLA